MEQQKKCECGHSREMHDKRIFKFENGKRPQKGEKDRGCKASNCLCSKYTEEE